MVGEVPSGDATNVEVSEGLAETAEESGADKKKGQWLLFVRPCME